MRLIEQLRWWAAECDRTNFGCQARKLLLEAAEALEKAEPVVRCKDCKFQGDEDDCPLLSVSAYTEPDDFCSYGERRGEDGT